MLNQNNLRLNMLLRHTGKNLMWSSDIWTVVRLSDDKKNISLSDMKGVTIRCSFEQAERNFEEFNPPDPEAGPKIRWTRGHLGVVD